MSSWRADLSIHGFDRSRPFRSVITSIRFGLLLRAILTQISDHGSPKHTLLASSVISKEGQTGDAANRVLGELRVERCLLKVCDVARRQRWPIFFSLETATRLRKGD